MWRTWNVEKVKGKVWIQKLIESGVLCAGEDGPEEGREDRKWQEKEREIKTKREGPLGKESEEKWSEPNSMWKHLTLRACPFEQARVFP